MRRSSLIVWNSIRRSFSYYIPKGMDNTEYLDTQSEVATKAVQLARLIAGSKKAICFTGAGISTSTGIPDYRSGHNTILPTGPGAWESEENKKKFQKEAVRVPTIQAIPSKTHMALSELVSRGIVNYIVTQNVDGLHRKSGVPEHKMTELHGGTNKEVCKTCNIEYFRDFPVRNRQNPESEHKTMRNCTNCGSPLHDTIVYFGQALRTSDKEKAQHESEKCDFGLVLGTSLVVAPASRYPGKFVNDPHKKLAIVNLQKTNLDKKCDLRIGAMCDTVMELTMAKLGIPIPDFKVNRWLSFQVSHDDHEYSTLRLKNYNREGVDFSAIKAVEIDLNADKSCDFIDLEKEPLHHKFKGNLHHLKCKFQFYRNNGEPDLEIGGDDWGSLWELLAKGREVVIHIQYSLGNKKWDVLEAKAL